ncbi:MAG TPA: sodium/solute symporter [Verrucomicrobiota bacterium]|nr:sodium/solute symporter [Verrucomicrobiota bacterium]HNU49546.1 sodium/solute symporter [Verrucomicrobiota bacterium]
MGVGLIDIVVFVVFVGTVIALGLWKSTGEQTRSEHGAQDYFLAGRGLTWWLIGFSLIAANISTEQFVGMSGQAADWLGMAIASYEWMAAITLVVVAFIFLPSFLKSGIYTIPEFLEYRYNTFARTVMAVSTMIILVGVPTASVIYSGAKVICVYFQGQSLLGFDLGNITVGCWIIGVSATVYVFAGGLKACAWADLIQGSALVLGGLIVWYLAMKALGSADPAALAATACNPALDPGALADSGAWSRWFSLNSGALPEGKLHMVRPLTDPSIPWSALVVGLWIPNFFYWGLNQYITQRTLGSKSLAEGQKGIVFAAFLKLLIPFVVVIPGILAFNLFHKDLAGQADLKNRDVEAAYTAKKAIVYQFTAGYAKLHPETAEGMASHNAALVKEAWAPPAAPLAPAELATRNAAFVAAAKTANVTVSQKLIGHDFDAAFPTLIRNLVPRGHGVLGFVLAALFGAVVSSIAAMLNAASTIFAMDIFRKVKKDASQYALVTCGRVCIVVFVLIALWVAPSLGSPAFGGIFTFIQEFQGFISPGILGVFLFGLLVHRAPRSAGTVGLVLNPILYGGLKYLAPGIAFLDRMAICLGVIVVVLTVMTLVKPLPSPVVLPVNPKMDMTPSRSAKRFGWAVVALTLALYVIFW